MHISEIGRPLLCDILIGRDQTVADIQAVIAEAHTGAPRMVVLSGEAGLGKTRLCRTIAETCEASGVHVLWGQALPHNTALPFSPFLDAFSRLRAIRDPHTDAVFAVLAPLMPDAATVADDGVTDNGAQRQNRLFGSLLDGLQVLAQTQPVLVILEDVQWADATSLDALSFLANRLDVNRATDGLPIMVMVTYRSEALGENLALTRLLVQLNTQRRLHEILLTALSPADHHRFLGQILGYDVADTYAAQLYERDEGNPFYIEELLGALSASGQLEKRNDLRYGQLDGLLDLPLSLKAAIVERVNTLPEADQDVLNYAAVIGRNFDFDLLAALTGLDERALLSVLRRAVKLQVIAEADERYQFRHALTRDAIYSDMLTRERRMRHRQIAETLVGHGTEAHRIAEHYSLANLPTEARPYALREAERARQVFAFPEERHYLTLAVIGLEPQSLEFLELAERIGMVNLALMDVAAAGEWFSRAQEGYRQLGQVRRVAGIMTHLTYLAWFFDSTRLPALHTDIDLTAQAAYANPDPAAQDIAALSLYAQNAFNMAASDHHAQALIWAERAATVAVQIESPYAQAALQLALVAQAVARIERDAAALPAELDTLRNVIAFSLRYNLPDLTLLSYSLLLQIVTESGLSDAVAQVVAEICDYERRAQSPPMANLKGWARIASGDWATAATELETVVAASVPPSLAALYRVCLVHILIERGATAEARLHLDRAWPVIAPMQFSYSAPAMWAWTKICVAEGDAATAGIWYDRVIVAWDATEDSGTCPLILLDALLFRIEETNLREARRILARLRTTATSGNKVAQAAVQTAEGVVAAAEGDISTALALLHTAAAMWQALGRPYIYAQTLHRLLTLVFANPAQHVVWHDNISTYLDEIARIYEMVGVGREAEITALRHSDPATATRKRRATLEEQRRPFAGLTRREVQVLIELGAGSTNKEIAATLHISEGTVELHVGHVLSKLNCSSRTQAVAYAIEHGWLKTGH